MPTRTLIIVALLASSSFPLLAQTPANAPRSPSDIEKQIQHQPFSAKLYVTLGLAYWDRNDYAHALEAFQQAVKLDPASPEAHNSNTPRENARLMFAPPTHASAEGNSQ